MSPPSQPHPQPQQPSTSPSPPHAIAPEGAISNHTPSPLIQSLISRLQHRFAIAKTHGLCSVAAAIFASTTSPTTARYTPPSHHTITSPHHLCPCKFQPPNKQQHTSTTPALSHPHPHPHPHTHPIVKGEPHDVLRKRISGMDQTAKLRVCRDAFLGGYKRSRTVEIEAAVKALFETQFSPGKTKAGLLGCDHYARKAKLKAKCCGLYVSCRFCHDQVMADDHEMDRFETERVLCLLCGVEGPVNAECAGCAHTFAHWFCKECRFYENTPQKMVYHCGRCNICRLGKGLGIDNYHCDNCDTCVSLASKERHQCITKATHTNCPVCRGYLFTSTEPVVFMRCGHTMHRKCFEDYTEERYQCPLCMRSLTDMTNFFRQIDQHVRNEPMPTEYQNKRSLITCNDCGNRSEAPYHFQYHKCPHPDCEGSYNTVVLKVFDLHSASSTTTRPSPSPNPLTSTQHNETDISITTTTTRPSDRERDCHTHDIQTEHICRREAEAATAAAAAAAADPPHESPVAPVDGGTPLARSPVQYSVRG